MLKNRRLVACLVEYSADGITTHQLDVPAALADPACVVVKLIIQKGLSDSGHALITQFVDGGLAAQRMRLAGGVWAESAAVESLLSSGHAAWMPDGNLITLAL